MARPLHIYNICIYIFVGIVILCLFNHKKVIPVVLNKLMYKMYTKGEKTFLFFLLKLHIFPFQNILYFFFFSKKETPTSSLVADWGSWGLTPPPPCLLPVPPLLGFFYTFPFLNIKTYIWFVP